jgi:23S rRNA pseudouridine1911/1915/1917 synthase
MSEGPNEVVTPRGRSPVPAVLHMDADLLALDKPAGVLSVKGRGAAVALADLLRGRGGVPADEPFRIVHRLDKDASGVILFARTLAAQRSLVSQFAGRSVEKVYLALVQGFVAEDGVIDQPLRTDKSGTRAEVSRRGKAAVTEYRVLERVAGNTLLECRPLTGRLHQIRVHLAALGHPLTVDPLYGGGTAVLLSHLKAGYRPDRRHGERPLIERLTLHAARVTVKHPTSGELLTVEAPLPKDLRATLSQLRRHAGRRGAGE